MYFFSEGGGEKVAGGKGLILSEKTVSGERIKPPSQFIL